MFFSEHCVNCKSGSYCWQLVQVAAAVDDAAAAFNQKRDYGCLCRFGQQLHCDTSRDYVWKLSVISDSTWQHCLMSRSRPTRRLPALTLPFSIDARRPLTDTSGGINAIFSSTFMQAVVSWFGCKLLIVRSSCLVLRTVCPRNNSALRAHLGTPITFWQYMWRFPKTRFTYLLYCNVFF